jgi:hypothetical protein
MWNILKPVPTSYLPFYDFHIYIYTVILDSTSAIRRGYLAKTWVHFQNYIQEWYALGLGVGWQLGTLHQFFFVCSKFTYHQCDPLMMEAMEVAFLFRFYVKKKKVRASFHSCNLYTKFLFMNFLYLCPILKAFVNQF